MKLKTIIHFLPNNLTPCGGIKVHYQLAEIEKELGYDVYIVYHYSKFPTWMVSTSQDIIVTTVDDVRIAALDPETTLVIGWEDIRELIQKFPTSTGYKRVSYIQGEALFDRSQLSYNIPIWYSSKWNMDKIGWRGDYIPVFIDTNLFHPLTSFALLAKKFSLPNVSMLVVARKGGNEKYRNIAQHLSSKLKEKFYPIYLNDVPEASFADMLRKTDITLCTSFPEGFGLLPLEAMACGSLAVGFTGGGGNEFMFNAITSFVSPDGDYAHIAARLEEISNLDYEDILQILIRGVDTAQQYNRENTKQYLIRALSVFEGE